MWTPRAGSVSRWCYHEISPSWQWQSQIFSLELSTTSAPSWRAHPPTAPIWSAAPPIVLLPADFRAALIASPPAIIAEIKQASPSKGVFTDDFHPASIAKLYEAGGAAALSILTDEEFFKGKLADLEAARSAVAIPVLRKDFTIDEFHIVEAAAHGADAILLIAAILDVQQLRGFRELAATVWDGGAG